MKTYCIRTFGNVEIEWKQAPRKNGKQVLTARREKKVLKCEGIDLFSPAARRRFAEGLANEADVEAEAVDIALMELAAALAAENAEDDDDQIEAVESDPLAAMPREVQEEARAMLESPDLMETIAHDIEILGVAGEHQVTQALYLVGTSRLLGQPFSACVQGSTSSGKSYVVKKVADLFPPESKHILTQMTEKALLHLPPGSLKNRWVVAGERSRREDKSSAEATRILRELLSDGRVSQANARGGTTQVIEQEGPISYTESTTLTQFFAEDSNRMLVLQTDERVSQTQQVIDVMGRVYRSGFTEGDQERVIAKHYAAQRMLEQRGVVIPFAENLSRRFPVDRVEARRGFPRLMSMIQAVCLLYQFQRETDQHGRLVATRADYRISRQLILAPLLRLLRWPVSKPATNFLERLKQRFAVEEVFTRSQAIQGEAGAERTIDGWFRQLREAGLIERVTAARGRRTATWRLPYELDMAENSMLLPTVDDVFGPEEPVELREAG